MSLSIIAETYCPSPLRPVLNRVKSSPIGRRIVSGAFWSIVGTGLAKALNFAALILVARILGKEGFGEFGLVRTTASMLVAFAGAGIGYTATKHVAELLHTDKERTGRIIGMGYTFTLVTSLLFGAVFFLLSPWICNSMINAPHLANEMRLASLLLVAVTFAHAQLGMMAGFQDFKGMTQAGVIAGILAVPSYVAGAYYAGLRGALVGLIAASMMELLVNYRFISRNTRKYGIQCRYFDAYKEISTLWNYSLPILLTSITLAVAGFVCQMMLAAQENGFSELGIYTAIIQIQTLIYFIPSHVNRVCFPTMSALQSNASALRKVFLLNFALNFLVTFALVLPISLAAGPILGLYGSEFSSGGLALAVVCFGLLAQCALISCNNSFLSSGRAWLHFNLTWVAYTVQILLSYWLVSAGYGALGLAIAFAVTSWIDLIVLLWITFIIFAKNEGCNIEKNLQN